MFVFVDETGNTGGNLFDTAQPDFLAGALITKTDFDACRSGAVRSLCRRHGISSIHGSVIGIDAIEKLSGQLLRILKQVDARFFISRVEKSYLLVTKLFDTFFDSGENPAVPFLTYNAKPLRLLLCFKVASLVDEAVAQNFWSMLMEKNEAKAREDIPGICDTFLERVHHLPDERSREVISETFSWARAHPEALDFAQARREAKKGHMPNLVAFINLLEGLEGYSKRWKRSVRRITHDRQSQFESTLREYHRLFAEAIDGPVTWFGDNFELRRVPGSEFKISSSEQSAGIQVADLFLWLFRQMINDKPLPVASTRLLRYCLNKSYICDFSFDRVTSDLAEKFDALRNTDLSSEALAQGKELIEEGERLRQHLIESYEINGLKPYQRGLPDHHVVVKSMLGNGERESRS